MGAGTASGYDLVQSLNAKEKHKKEGKKIT
jgi:hypothetical protein